MKQVYYMTLIFSLAVLISIMGCTTVSEVPQPPKSEAPAVHAEEKAQEVRGLSWDNEERKAWTVVLKAAIDANWDKLSFASDMPLLCNPYRDLEKKDQLKVWAELFVAMAYFESGWKADKKFYEKSLGYNSEGLFQLSVVDEPWLKCGLTKTSILTAPTNIACAVKIMSRQVDKNGKVLLSKGAYWSVIKTDSKYKKIDEIKKRIASAMPECA